MAYSFFKRTFFLVYRTATASPEDAGFEESLERLARESIFVSFETPRFGSTLSLNPPDTSSSTTPPQPPSVTSPPCLVEVGSCPLQWASYKKEAKPSFEFASSAISPYSCHSESGCFIDSLRMISSRTSSAAASGNFDLSERAAVAKAETSRVNSSGEFAVGSSGFVAELKALYEKRTCLDLPAVSGGRSKSLGNMRIREGHVERAVFRYEERFRGV